MKANSQSQGLFVCLFSRCIGEKQERDKTRRDSEDPGGDRDGAPCWVPGCQLQQTRQRTSLVVVIINLESSRDRLCVCRRCLFLYLFCEGERQSLAR